MAKRWLNLAWALLALAAFKAIPASAQDRLQHRTPPAEAVQACSGLQDGAPCSFTHHEHQISGTCRVPPGGDAAACMPAKNMLHHGPPPEALQACSGLQNGDACSFTHAGHEISGSCRTGPDGKNLACFPAHPRGAQ